MVANHTLIYAVNLLLGVILLLSLMGVYLAFHHSWRSSRVKSLVVAPLAALAGVSGALWLLLFVVSRPTYDIDSISRHLEYRDTRFEFRYGDRECVLDDPYSRFRYVYGRGPDTVSLEGDTRVVVYESPGAIIKSWSDSIEVGEEEIHLKGWMGIWLDFDHDYHLTPDWRGTIHY